jgi:O-antigen ligase
MNKNEFPIRYSYVMLLGLACSMLTTVAGINIFLLLLLLVAPWFWREFELDTNQKTKTLQFLGLIFGICAWDVVTNLLAGSGFVRALVAMQHDLRTFGFILVLWAMFSVVKVARFALFVLMGAFVVIATANLLATMSGVIKPGEYLWYTMHHLYGQMIVGFIFLLAQMLLVRPELSWRAAVPMLALMASMFFATERRAGILLLVAGLPLWVLLNHKRFSIGRYRWWLVAAAVAVVVGAMNSSIIQTRMMIAVQEIQNFIQRDPIERANDFSSVGLRLQFYVSIWELIKAHWFLGVGSIQFAELFQQVNLAMGTTEPQRFTNPHNEYLFIWATKGVVGLLLYLGIFVQACRLAWVKQDEVQRNGLIMFVYLFMVSIFMNSMMVDMEEGHFTMLILLMFLAPNKLDLFKPKESVEFRTKDVQ